MRLNKNEIKFLNRILDAESAAKLGRCPEEAEIIASAVKGLKGTLNENSKDKRLRPDSPFENDMLTLASSVELKHVYLR